jgi:hypothetical protein
MRSIILGIMVTQQPTTTLTVELPAVDGDAFVQIVYGSTSESVRITGNGRVFQTSLAPGQYVLLVDSTLRPSAAAPFTVTTDADAAFWSTAHPDTGSNPRPWQSGAGRFVSAPDPKDPWPKLPPLSSTSEAFVASSSPIAPILGELLTANTGRGASSAGLWSASYAR